MRWTLEAGRPLERDEASLAVVAEAAGLGAGDLVDELGIARRLAEFVDRFHAARQQAVSLAWLMENLEPPGR